jgi:VCBS repeat-containing protein
VSYTYTLNDNETHAPVQGSNSLFEDLTVSLTDRDDDNTTGTLSVNIVDDVPDAIADTNLGTANENSVTLTGNVLTNDVQGADGAAVTPVTSLAGTYGSITIGADGAYTYTLNPADADFTALVGGATGTETFTYTLIDGDGDTDTAVLTLNIKNDDDSVTITDLTPKAEGGDVTVNENDLLASRGLGESAGSDSTPESTTQAGTFTITAADGVKTLTIGTLNVITAGVYVGDGTFGTTPLGNTLTITGYDSATGVVSYTYTLNDNETHAPVQGTNSLFEDLTVSLTDRDDDNTTGMLSVNIVDDVPSFTQIMQGIVANQAGILSGTHNIAFGADGEGSINLSALTQVTGLNYSTATHNLDGSTTITAGTGTSDTGFFSLTIKSDGTYDFTLIDPRPSVDKTVFFGTVSGSAGVPVLTIGSGSDQIIFTGLGGDTIKPTSAGFGVNDGNLNPGDDFSISFAGNLVDSVSFTVKHQGSGLFSMNWVTDSGETGTVSTSVDATIKVDPTSDFSSISFYTISGNAKVDSFNYSQNLLPPDQVLQFSISAIDGDGDISASQILGISLLGDAIGSPIVGTGLDESILGSNYAESIDGGAGNDIIVGGLAADTLTGGSGADTFKFAAGDSGQSTGYDTITDYAKGVDIISYTTSMVIGGNANPVTTNEASINQTTGVATFAVGSGTTLSDALNDIATRFTSATTDSAGKFALFQLAGTGNYYVFISDGVAGVTANDVVINLNGVTSITSVSLTGSTLKITPIAIDLNADGITYLNRNAGVMYDYNQDGTAESTAWVAGTDGLLAMQNKDGSLSITFSTQAGETDLQGLAKTYDVNLDGVLDQNDSSFGRFGVWQDANSDGKVETGEFKSLTDAGIASIGLHSDGQAYTTAGGDVDVSGASTYTRTDGSSGVVEDATFAVTNQDASLTIYNSVITDTQGDNILTGTLRVDVFKWSLNDQGTAGAPANDVVTNFSIAQGDSLDLRDLLSNEHDGSLTGLDNNLSSYLHFDKVGSDTVVSISTEGKFDGSLDTSKIDQTITLTDVDLIGHFTEQQDMINDVLNKQIITVDH